MTHGLITSDMQDDDGFILPHLEPDDDPNIDMPDHELIDIPDRPF